MKNSENSMGPLYRDKLSLTHYGKMFLFPWVTSPCVILNRFTQNFVGTLCQHMFVTFNCCGKTNVWTPDGQNEPGLHAPSTPLGPVYDYISLRVRSLYYCVQKLNVISLTLRGEVRRQGTRERRAFK